MGPDCLQLEIIDMAKQHILGWCILLPLEFPSVIADMWQHWDPDSLFVIVNAVLLPAGTVYSSALVETSSRVSPK